MAKKISMFISGLGALAVATSLGGAASPEMVPVTPAAATAPAAAETLEAYPRTLAAPWLGVRVQDFDAPLRQAFDYRGNGVIVSGVRPGSPAERAQISPGDVITHIGADEISNREELARGVRGHQPGDVLRIRLRRNGKEEVVEVVLAVEPDRPRSRSSWLATSYLGARVETLSPDLAAYFGVDPGAGVLVVATREGGPAARAGLRPGDVLTQLDGVRIGSPDALTTLLKERAPHSRLAGTVVRHGREEEIEVILGESSALDSLFEQIHLGRDDLDSLLSDLRARVNQGEDPLSEPMKRLEETIRDLEGKIDELVDRARK